MKQAAMQSQQPIIAIVGRPNVGKSTLFNRLAGKQLAIVNDQPGITRDYRAAPLEWDNRQITLYDTAGYDTDDEHVFAQRMREQTKRAADAATVILFVIDGRAGITAEDRNLAQILRRQKKPVVLAVNKIDNKVPPEVVAEAYRLGFGTPHAISASHGDGVADLIGTLLQTLPQLPITEDTEIDEDETLEANKPLRLAIVGRPNVGKSTLVNALLGEPRVITGAEPGLTRDAIAVDWQYNDTLIRLVDTAGLRRRSRVQDKVEKMAVDDTLRIIRLAEVVVLVVDATALLDRQDLTIAQLIVDEGRAFILAINKWDLVVDKYKMLDEIEYLLGKNLSDAKGVTMITMSALNGGKALTRLMDSVLETYQIWNRRISTAKLNKWLDGILAHHPPPLVAGRPIRLRYMTQVKSRPPSFAIWVSRPEELPMSYERYLINNLRKDFDLPGVPVRLLLRKGDNPYKDNK